MKALPFVLLLAASTVLVLIGCSDNPAAPVSPTDQSAQMPASLEKSNKVDFECTAANISFDHNPEKWLAGRTLHMRNVHAFEAVTATDLRIAGRMEHFLSLSLDVVTGEGPCHGSWTLTPDPDVVGADAVWEGTYEGYRSYKAKIGELYIFTLPLKLVGHGRGGSIDGMKSSMTITLTVVVNPAIAPFPAPIYWSGDDGVGTIIQH